MTDQSGQLHQSIHGNHAWYSFTLHADGTVTGNSLNPSSKTISTTWSLKQLDHQSHKEDGHIFWAIHINHPGTIVNGPPEWLYIQKNWWSGYRPWFDYYHGNYEIPHYANYEKQ